jgi:hypothetical protein
METIELTPKRFNEVVGEYDLEPETVKVEITLGVADHVRNEIPDREDSAPIPCIVYEITDKNTLLGTGSHPGYIYALTWDEVQELWGENYNGDWIYLNVFGANRGTHLDMEHDNDPICEDCIAAGSAESFEYDKNPESDKACWSCCQMIDEGLEQKDEERQYRNLKAGEYR